MSGKTVFEAKEIRIGSNKNFTRKNNQTSDVKQENVKLLQLLKNLRLKLAREKNVPAYVVFPDKSLAQMANAKPITHNDFLMISGVGEKKLEEYFEPFSKEIQLYVNNLSH